MPCPHIRTALPPVSFVLASHKANNVAIKQEIRDSALQGSSRFVPEKLVTPILEDSNVLRCDVAGAGLHFSSKSGNNTWA